VVSRSGKEVPLREFALHLLEPPDLFRRFSPLGYNI